MIGEKSYKAQKLYRKKVLTVVNRCDSISNTDDYVRHIVKVLSVLLTKQVAW